MDLTADELAGVVDLFGGLTRSELERALAEAAFRADGDTVTEDDLAAAIDEAVEAFALVRYDAGGADVPAASANGDGPDATEDAPGPLLVAGPTAFPRVPEGGEDLPHILDVERRRLDREALGEAVRDRFEAAVAEALAGAGGADGSRTGDGEAGDPRAGTATDETSAEVADGTSADGVDPDRVRRLLEVSYDVEAWAPVDVDAERERLEAALDE